MKNYEPRLDEIDKKILEFTTSSMEFLELRYDYET
jgi:hypothetical protein